MEIIVHLLFYNQFEQMVQSKPEADTRIQHKTSSTSKKIK